MNFPGEPKMVQEHIFPGEAKCTRTKFQGELSQNSARIQTIF